MDILDVVVYTGAACLAVLMVSSTAAVAAGAYWLWMLVL